MTDDKLKPCPFCGGEASIFYAVDIVTGDYHKIICQGVCDLDFNGFEGEGAEDLVHRWNTRHLEQSLETAVQEPFKESLHSTKARLLRQRIAELEQKLETAERELEAKIRRAVEMSREEGDIGMTPTGWTYRSPKYSPIEIVLTILGEGE